MAENVLKPVEADGLSATAEISSDWRPFETLRREIDRLFQDIETGRSLVRPSFGGPVFDFEPFSRGETSWGAIPAVDVVEKDNHFEISAELPGVDAGDIEVNVNMDTLRIKGEKREGKEAEDQKQDFHLSERRFGPFQRTFRFPEHVDPDKIEASFRDGVLTIILPKSEETQPPGKNIPIRTK
jgi:HSP20 family protein